jgi:translocation and assembly module TamA
MKKKALLIAALLCCFAASTVSAAVVLRNKISGLSGAALKNTQLYLDNNLAAIKPPLNATIIQQQFQQAPDLIRKALQPFGYFKPRIAQTLQRYGDNWQAFYAIDPGPLLRINRVDLQISGAGANEPALQALRRNFPLRSGQPLITTAYNHAKQLLFDVAEQQGYIDAQIIPHQIIIDLRRYTATIILHLQTGARFFFGAVRFTPTPLRESFLRRYLPFAPGQPYSTTRLLNLQNALSNSPYFSQVNVQPLRDEIKNQQVPIAMALTPLPARRYSAGIGYGTDTGPRLSLGSNWRHITSSGHQLNTQLQISPVQNSLQATYTIPGYNPAADQYALKTTLLQNRLSQGSSLTKQLGVSAIKKYGRWQRTLALNYQIERFQFKDQSAQSSNLLIPSIDWLYLQTDNPIYTQQGQRFAIHLQGSDQALISSTRFLQAEMQEKYIHSFNADSRIILRADLGYTYVDNLQTFPLSLRFYAGGSQSVRGYNFQNLGPGRYLAVGSAEYQHTIIGNWKAAVFYDAGNAVNNLPLKPLRSAGAGLVWISPLGPLELTLAQRLSQPGHMLKIQFAMGPDLG